MILQAPKATVEKHRRNWHFAHRAKYLSWKAVLSGSFLLVIRPVHWTGHLPMTARVYTVPWKWNLSTLHITGIGRENSLLRVEIFYTCTHRHAHTRTLVMWLQMGEDCVSLHLIGNWINKNFFSLMGSLVLELTPRPCLTVPCIGLSSWLMLTVSAVALISQEDAFTETFHL